VKKPKKILYDFLKCLTAPFKPRYLVWHATAIALTVVLIFSGFDWFFFQNTRNTSLLVFLFPSIIIGLFVPIMVPLVYLILGKIRKNKEIFRKGYILALTGLASDFISYAYKAVTGRAHPHLVHGGENLPDITRDFAFGFMERGVFWGWPSSHTTVAFAVGIVLFFLYQKNPRIKFLALFYAFYTGIGVSATIHWFSDFVAGAIIGTVVGFAILKLYLKIPTRCEPTRKNS